MKKSSLCETPTFFGGGAFHQNGGHHFGTSGSYFDLGKHVHFVISSIYTEFGEGFKKLKNSDFGHMLAIYGPLALIFNTP